jgi:hypothetical protein
MLSSLNNVFQDFILKEKLNTRKSPLEEKGAVLHFFENPAIGQFPL